MKASALDGGACRSKERSGKHELPLLCKVPLKAERPDVGANHGTVNVSENSLSGGSSWEKEKRKTNIGEAVLD